MCRLVSMLLSRLDFAGSVCDRNAVVAHVSMYRSTDREWVICIVGLYVQVHSGLLVLLTW